MIVSWFSAGISSFVATYLNRSEIDKIIYIHIEDQHPDSMRFVMDCEKVLQREIEILQSPYKTVENVSKAFGCVNTIYGSKCTEILKRRVRKEWECSKNNLTYVWGFDVSEKQRAERLIESMPEQQHTFPLIDRMLTKQDCHGMASALGIKRPLMYDLGYSNNNCVGCVKGGMGYWNKVRKDFPEVFEQRATMEREIGYSCLNGLFLDELDPNRGRMEDEILEDCGIMCQLNL